MQVYKLFFQVLRKQKGQIIMYLVIFLSVALAAASQGGKKGEATFSPTTFGNQPGAYRLFGAGK